MTKSSKKASAKPAIAASPTLEDVAKLAGVSTATVSRCLNSPAQVSKKTQKQVMDAVDALGYAPNFGARALAAKKTNTFGAIIPTMDNAIFARGLQAFQEELGEIGITLLVASSSYKPELEEKQIRALVARGADALLLIGQDRTNESYQFLEKRQIPYVLAWTFDASQSRPSIGFDNRKAMAELASSVIGLGHKELAMISAPINGNDRARERYEGVCEAMLHNGLSAAQLRLIETPYSFANGLEAFAEIMRGSKKPTAILCGNDVLAAGALTGARSQNLRVPEDISITGFDDIEISEIVNPGLTTVHVPHRAMGKKAAQTLVAMRNGHETQKSFELEVSIKWRQSLGPA